METIEKNIVPDSGAPALPAGDEVPRGFRLTTKADGGYGTPLTIHAHKVIR